MDEARGESEQFLLRAFRSFAEAASSLERSYGMLRSEVSRLNGELEESNAGLRRSFEENRRMRLHLDRILEGLPCGVVVAQSDGTILRSNPEGRRLLLACGLEAGNGFASLDGMRRELRDLLLRARESDGLPSEAEQSFAGTNGDEYWIAVRHAAVHEPEAGSEGLAQEVSVFILRDVSEAKRLVRERERMRRDQALAEMSAILAHEIRNPLGSLELFAGLLAGAPLASDCREWVQQVQAGLRTLGATVNNVLHFHSLPSPQRVAIDLGQLLDWAGGFCSPWPGRREWSCVCATGCRPCALQGIDIGSSRCC